MFDGRVTVLTPTKNTRAEDYDLLESFWQGLGSVVVQMSAEEHDRALAVTSHLPHMAAAALANTVPENYFRLAGSGLLDSARLASGDPEIWQQILHAEPRQRAEGPGAIWRTASGLAHGASATATKPGSIRFLTKAKKNRDALGN